MVTLYPSLAFYYIMLLWALAELKEWLDELAFEAVKLMLP